MAIFFLLLENSGLLVCSLNPPFSLVIGSFFDILFGIGGGGGHYYPNLYRSHSGPQIDHGHHITNELSATENLSEHCYTLIFFYYE